MFQFKTAKDRPLTIVFDSKAKKIINQFEFDNQSQEPFADERDVEVQFTITNLKELNFEKDSRRKRTSIDTVFDTKCFKQKVDENLPPTAQKKHPEKKIPIYYMNSLLIFKTRHMKLDPEFRKIRDQILEDCLIVRIQYRRIEDLVQELDLYFVKSYFEHNHSMTESNWLEHHGNLIAWKLISRKIYSLQRLVSELEYRYFIEYVQNQRSVIQQILSNDVYLGVHLVLVIVQVEITLSRSILELSDGWYSIFFVSDSNPIYKKMKRGMKIHIMNMTEYPIKFNFTKSRLMSKYKFSTQIVTANLNSIKKADDSAILGIQQSPYFLRSIKSLRFGRIPCLDVVICGISYIVINQQAIKNVEDGSVINCYLRVCDNLHYFEGSFPEKKSFINVQLTRLTLDIYDSLKCGMRIRLINTMQTHYGFVCDLGRSSGMYLSTNLALLIQINSKDGGQKIKLM